MQISVNTTGMQAGLAVVADKAARDHCIVVVKGTFQADERGQMELVAEQRPLIYADEHYGSPENSSIRYESDFALEKRLTDVVVVGKAVAPGRQRSPEVMVRLEVQGRAKDLRVMGERRWLRILGTVAPCDPVPFAEMPLTFDRAFGGEDASNGPQKVAVERRNPSGVGFYPLKPTKEAEGLALANLEPPKQRIASFRDKVDPVGFGFIGRHWKPRVGYAGTYDQRWRDETSPFLPSDFDPGTTSRNALAVGRMHIPTRWGRTARYCPR